MSELTGRLRGVDARRMLSRLRGAVGLTVLLLGHAVMASALIQYLLAHNSRRRMDFAVTGGAAGVALVVLGGVVLLAERALLHAAEEEQAEQALLRRLLRPAGPALVAVPDLVVATDHSFHRPDCLLVDGRSGLAELSLAHALGSERTACRLCLKGVS